MPGGPCHVDALIELLTDLRAETAGIMTSAMKFTVIFLISLIKYGHGNTAAQQMRSWYDFLNSLGSKKLVVDPGAVQSNSPFGGEQMANDVDLSRMGDFEEEQDNVMTPDSYCKKETAARLKCK